MKTELGFSMIEVLVTIVILVFGLLGLAGMQARMVTLEMESYQRSQALLLLNDMAARIEARVAANGANYVTATPLGTGDVQPSSCTSVAVGADRDKCEWSNLLKGATEISGANKVGGMIGARGCITEVQAPNPAAGVCTPGIYQVEVAWQGIVGTAAPSFNCGSGLYGDEALRRLVSLRVSAATVACVL